MKVILMCSVPEDDKALIGAFILLNVLGLISYVVCYIQEKVFNPFDWWKSPFILGLFTILILYMDSLVLIAWLGSLIGKML